MAERGAPPRRRKREEATVNEGRALRVGDVELVIREGRREDDRGIRHVAELSLKANARERAVIDAESPDELAKLLEVAAAIFAASTEDAPMTRVGGVEERRELAHLLESARSPALLEVLRILRLAAPTQLPVLLEGEPGAGVELLAGYLHLRSTRADGPLVPLDVGSLRPDQLETALFDPASGAFARAHGGTLFLAGIEELPSALQARLVERLAGDPKQARVVAGAQRDLRAAVDKGELREDLRLRLNVARLRLPPLRERRDDVSVLLELFLGRSARALHRSVPTLTTQATNVLVAYAWPGNEREVEALAARLVTEHAGGAVRDLDLPLEYCLEHLGNLAMWHARRGHRAEVGLYDLATEHFERTLVKFMVDRCGGNMAEAARRLGVSYSTVKNKMYGS